MAGRRDDAPPASTVFVGNLSYDLTDQDVIDHFGQVGPVKHVRIVTDRETGKPRGFGFIEFYDIPTAESAIRNLSGKDFKGRTIRIVYAEGGPGEFRSGGGPPRDFDRYDDRGDRGGPPMGGDRGGPPPGRRGPMRDRVVGGDLSYHSAHGVAALLDAPLPAGAPADAITHLLARRSRAELYDYLAQMQGLLGKNPGQARQILMDNPQLTKALFQMQVILGMVSNPLGDIAPKGVAPPNLMPRHEPGMQGGGPGGPGGPMGMQGPPPPMGMQGPPDMMGGPAPMGGGPLGMPPPGMQGQGPPPMGGPPGMPPPGMQGPPPPGMGGPPGMPPPYGMQGPPPMGMEANGGGPPMGMQGGPGAPYQPPPQQQQGSYMPPPPQQQQQQQAPPYGMQPEPMGMGMPPPQLPAGPGGPGGFGQQQPLDPRRMTGMPPQQPPQQQAGMSMPPQQPQPLQQQPPVLGGTGGLSQEQQQALLQQVMSLTPAQIDLLPPQQKAQVLALQQQLRPGH